MASRGQEFRGGGRGDRGRGAGRGGDNRGRGGGGDRGRGSYGDRGRGSDRGSARGGGRGRGGVFSPPGLATVDSRLTDKSDDELVKALQSLSISPADRPPLRPDFGISGVPIKLRANFFQLQTSKKDIFEYDVSITPTVDDKKKRLRRRIFQLAENSAAWQQANLKGNVAHDHSSKLISSKKLPTNVKIVVKYYHEDSDGPDANSKEYTLTLRFIQVIETSSLTNYLEGRPNYRDYDILPVLAALNIVLAAHPNRSGNGGGIMVGRNRFFFRSAATPASLGGGLEAWRGFYSSVRPAHLQLQVNVNVCTTAFYIPGPLDNALTAFMSVSNEPNPNSFVKGLRVRATHLNYRKTIKAVAQVNADNHFFDHPRYGKINVTQYFKKEYDITLKNPERPLMIIASPGKIILLPTQVLEILPNQAFKGKLSDDATANMILAACQPPNINAQAIIGPGLKELGYLDTAAPLGAFEISISKDMVIVPGRILASPSLQYGEGRGGALRTADDRASWNLRDVKFLKSGKLGQFWAVLVIKDGNRDEYGGRDDPDLRQHVGNFISCCQRSGVAVANANPVAVLEVQLPPRKVDNITRDRAAQVIEQTIKGAFGKPASRPTFILVMLSNGDKHVYASIKTLLDTKLDVHSVCVHAGKFKKDNVQYYANVALKVNMKMGGVNHILHNKSTDRNDVTAWLKQAPTMILGMDVTHPGPGSTAFAPSVAAVVGSIDDHFAQYPASLEVQKSRKEMITALESCVVARIVAYKAKNANKLPQRIIVYRDGVSEGQFAIVRAEELPCIKAAIRKFSSAQAPYNPKLTIIICGKRHNTRFYPTSGSVTFNQRDVTSADRDGNPVPGTVVDRGVSSVYEYDFFLQAHGGLQGTTRPTHYYVVHDEIKFRADALQSLTNAISYTFARATKAVSLAAPAYYADLAAERGRCYLNKLLNSSSSAPSTIGSTKEEKDAAEDAVMKRAIGLWNGGVNGQNLKDSMFYL